MEIKDLIEVLEAAERGEQIEVLVGAYADIWGKWQGKVLHMDMEYRIVPTKHELSLVEELRTLNPQFYSEWKDLAARAADRIEELEGFSKKSLYCYTTDELLAEIKRRTE